MEIGKGALLAIIAILCALLGLVVANQGQLPDFHKLDKTTAVLAALYLLPNIPFLAYRQMYSAPRSENHDENSRKWVLMWLAVTALAMLVFTWLDPQITHVDLLCALLLSSPFVFYCYQSFRLYLSADTGTAADKRHRGFENLIFIPAFLLCLVNFSVGLLLRRRFAHPFPGLTESFNLEDISYVLVSLAVVAWYYRGNVRAAYIYVAFPLLTIAIGLFGFFALGLAYAKYFALAFMVTFFLGFGEVAKNLWFLRRDRTLNEDGSGPSEFFMQGANWSGVVYPTICLLAPAVFKEMSFLPIVLIVYLFVLVWLGISPKLKTSKFAVVIAFSVGYGTPLAFIAAFSHVADFHLPPITDQTPFQTLLALIALVGFMAGLLRLAKDLFGLNLAALTRNIWSRNLYANQAACLYLLLVISLLVCVLLTCAWFILFVFPDAGEPGTRNQYANRLALAGIAVAVLAVLAVVLTIFRPTRLATIIAETTVINNMPAPTRTGPPMQQLSPISEQGWTRTLLLILSSGRLGVSSIAGAAAATMTVKLSWLPAVAAFLSLTMVTMSGFLMNDIYDRDKDRLAGKRRPITTGELTLRHAARSAAIFVFVPIVLTLFVFGLGPAAWIAVIALALFAYSPVAKRVPLIKGIYTAALAVSPFIFARDAADARVPMLLIVLLFLYIFFREAVLDAVDGKGDHAANIHTIAFYLGSFRTSLIGWTGMFCALGIGLPFLGNPISELLVVGALIAQIIATLMFVGRVPYSVGVTRISMILGVGAVALAS